MIIRSILARTKTKFAKPVHKYKDSLEEFGTTSYGVFGAGQKPNLGSTWVKASPGSTRVCSH